LWPLSFGKAPWKAAVQSVVVPAGFVTDLASIPRVLRNLPWLDPNGLSRRPAVSMTGCTGPPQAGVSGKILRIVSWVTRFVAEGASLTVASTFHAAVHWFGRSSWDDDGRRLAAPNTAP
jgi:hypothetical protein